MTIEGLSSFVLLALVGGLHCAGMCGGFAVMAAGNTQRRRILVQRQLLFLAGKSLTYAMLGFAASLSAGWLVSRFEGIGTEAEVSEMLLGLRSGLARFAGLTMVLFGLGMLGWQRFRSMRLPEWMTASLTRVRFFLRSVAALPGYAGPFGLGLTTGLLPCGLSWSAVTLAAAATPTTAFVGCFLFGLGTAPALMVIGLGWDGLRTKLFRRHAAKCAGGLLLVFGAYTMVRGGALVTHSTQAVLPECCQPGH